MFTVCLFTFASLLTDRYTSMECRERVTQEAVDEARVKCAAIDKDPFHTCEMVKMSEDKYVVYIRKMDGV